MYIDSQIQLNKQISMKCLHFLENTCKLNKSKRYDWNQVLNDPFLLNDSNTQNTMTYNDIENISKCLHGKIQYIQKYYSSLLNSNNNVLTNNEYSAYYNEIAICLIFAILEIKLYLKFIKHKQQYDDGNNSEIHFINIYRNTPLHNDHQFTGNKNVKYNYSYLTNVNINIDDKALDVFVKDFICFESELQMIVNTIFKEIGVDGVVGDSNINSLTKGGYWGNIEKYFHCLFDNACLHYMKKEFKKALEEFQIARYIIEYMLFIKIITIHNKDECGNHELNMFDINENGNTIRLFTFIGGIIKTFSNHNVIEDKEEEMNDDNNMKLFDELISLYPELTLLIKECERNV